jgi:hypothetical protein
MIQLLVAFEVSNGRQSSGIFKNSLKLACQCLIDVLILSKSLNFIVLVLSSSLPWLDGAEQTEQALLRG